MNERTFLDEIATLVADIRQYLDDKYKLAKLDVIEKLLLLSTALIVIMCVFFFIASFALFLSFSLAYYLGDLWNSKTLGFTTVAGIYFLFGIILIVFKKYLIAQPVLKYLLKVFFKQNPKTKKDED